MVKIQTGSSDRKEAPGGQDRSESNAGEHARERLLRELPVAERRLELNGVASAVLEGGSGSPVVLLHGPGEYAAKWFRVIPSLVTTHRVIAPDLPGHGSSEGIDGHLDADRILGWLDDLIECTCPTSPALVGHVLGGAIAACFAAERGGRLRKLVLVDSLGLTAFQPTREFGSALHAYLSTPTQETHDLLWSRCAFDLDGMRNRMGETWEWIRAYNLDRARDPRLQATQQGLMEQFGMPAISPEKLGRMTVPTSLIWGRHDAATPLTIAQAASSRYGWPLQVIEEAGDDPPMEQPEAFLESLLVALDAPGGTAILARSQGAP